MKVLVAILTALLAGCIGGPVFAKAVVEINQNGEYRFGATTDHWESTAISITDEVQRYIESAKKAKESPGEFIPVATHEVPRGMSGLFGLKKDIVASVGVIYDQNDKEIVMINDPTVLSSTVVFGPFFVWWALGLLSMIWLNVRRPQFDAPVLDIAVSLVATLGVVFALVEASLLTPLLSTLLFFSVIFPLAYVGGRQEGKEKGLMYWTASTAIYVMLAVLLISTYSA